MTGGEAAKTPGAMIAAARQQRALTRDDLAERTKIPAALLAALEADEYHRLSGPLYARSFLRACARELGLDETEVFAAYERQGGEPAREAGVGAPVAEPVRIRRVGLPWGRIAAGGLALTAAVVLALRLAGPGGGNEQAATTEPRPHPGAAGPERTPARAAAGAAAADVATGAGGPDGTRPAAPAGVPQLVFGDGATWPLVARLQYDGRAAVRCRRDGEPGYTAVVWPANGPAAAPPAGITAGTAYADGAGYVVYWGAVARLSLVLEDATGCALTVNGEPWPLVAPPGGGEVVVDIADGALPLP